MWLLLVQVPQPPEGVGSVPVSCGIWGRNSLFCLHFMPEWGRGFVFWGPFFLLHLSSLPLHLPGDEPDKLSLQHLLLPPRLGIGIIIWISAITDRSSRYRCFITFGTTGDFCPDIWIHVTFLLWDWLWKMWIYLSRLTSADLRDRAPLAFVWP